MKDKEYTIIQFNNRTEREKEVTGTLSYLISYFKYTLETGKSYQSVKGNKKIDIKPKTIKSLIKNLNNARNNAATNGYSEVSFYLKGDII